MAVNLMHFNEDEFKRCTPSCSSEDCDKEALERLDLARTFSVAPFRLTCAYRSKEYDEAKGRSGNSAHTRGKAFDIACTTSTDRVEIVRGALLAGFHRIGIAPTFVHIDCDLTLPACIWLYK